MSRERCYPYALGAPTLPPWPAYPEPPGTELAVPGWLGRLFVPVTASPLRWLTRAALLFVANVALVLVMVGLFFLGYAMYHLGGTIWVAPVLVALLAGLFVNAVDVVIVGCLAMAAFVAVRGLLRRRASA